MYINMPDLMHQPLVLNYWGPTGTGKTQLVRKLVALTGLQKRFVHINLANTGVSRWLSKMDDIAGLVDKDNPQHDNPVVLFFDEVQHARTINEQNHEIQHNDIADIWGILDHGVQFVTGISVPTIIFVAGNIDLYAEENIQNWQGPPEDERQSVTIPIQMIHDALSKRFRPEMLARLRNNHYLFPPIDKIRALHIIHRDLTNIQSKIQKYYPELILRYNDSLIAFIFNQIQSRGMGARGIEASVADIVHSKIGYWLLLPSEKGYLESQIRDIELEGKDDDIIVKITMSDDVVIKHVESLKVQQNYHGSFNAEEISVHAVHEAGHALSAFLANGIAPDLISVGTTIGKVKAYVKYSTTRKTLSKKEMAAYVAQLLGGLLAEEIVFGSDGVTHGAKSDLQEVYHVVSESLMESGLGRSMLTRKVAANFFEDSVPPFNTADRAEIEAFIQITADNVRKLLQHHEKALIALAQQVFYRGEINREEFIEIMEITIDKRAFAAYHQVEDKDHLRNPLSIATIADSITFSYVNALFRDLQGNANSHVLIGRNATSQKGLLLK